MPPEQVMPSLGVVPDVSVNVTVAGIGNALTVIPATTDIVQPFVPVIDTV